LWQSCFATDGIDAVACDDAETLGMRNGRIFSYPEKKNWWSRAGVPGNMPVGEPGGPDTEMFWDFDPKCERKYHENSAWASEPCHVNCDCGRFMEIGNNVFMQYVKTERGFEELPQRNVDFGGGLERLASAVKNDPDMFLTDTFASAREIIGCITGSTYNAETMYAYRVILDHIRAATFLISDGALPGNKDQGYFVRRLIRRAVRFARKLGTAQAIVVAVAEAYITHYQEAYPNLGAKKDEILHALEAEEGKCGKTIEQ
jgi:alanyl-tRNA synthetase